MNEIEQRVHNRAIEDGKSIQKKIDKIYPNSFEVKKYFNYTDETQEEKCGEQVFIKRVTNMDWKQYGSYGFSIPEKEVELIKGVMNDYKFNGMKMNIKNKGKTFEIYYPFSKEYKVDED